MLLLPWDKLWAFIGLWTMLDWIYWFNKTPLRNGLSNDWPIGIYSAMTVFMGIAFLLFKSQDGVDQSKFGVKADRVMAPPGHRMRDIDSSKWIPCQQRNMGLCQQRDCRSMYDMGLSQDGHGNIPPCAYET